MILLNCFYKYMGSASIVAGIVGSDACCKSGQGMLQ